MILILFLMLNLNGGDVIVSWDKNQEKDLAGYKIYYGFKSRTYTFNKDVGLRTRYIFSNLDTTKTYYFSVTAYDTAKNESYYSKELRFQFRRKLYIRNATLQQNYPNPFNEMTVIKYILNDEMNHVNLSIFNIKGEKIRTLINTYQSIGQHSILWDGKSDQDQYVPSGTYLYKLIIFNRETDCKKLIMVK